MSDWLNISKLKEHPQNPRVHTSEQIQKIADNIRANGWGRPIIISKDFYILAGHGAVQAALKLGLTKVPVKYLEPRRRHDEPEAIAYMVADNKTTDDSDWNYEKLETIFEELQLEGFNTKFTGFDEDELDFMVSEDDEDIIGSCADDAKEKIYSLPLIFDQDHYELYNFLNNFTGKGKTALERSITFATNIKNKIGDNS